MNAGASSSTTVGRALTRARRRLAARAGLVRAGWSLLAGVVLLEVGLAAGAALDVAWAWLPGAGAIGLAPALLALAPRPAPALAAAVLDAQLGAGATLATAAEALEGRHGRFSGDVLAEAERALSGRSLAAALPLRAPAALLLGAAAAALLPAVLLGARAGLVGTTRDAGPDGPTLALDLRPAAPGGGAGAATPADDAAAPDRLAVAPVEPQADAAPGAVIDPSIMLPPEVAAVFGERLAAELAALPALPPGTGDPATDGGAPADDDALAAALRAGDAAGALHALDDLARAAAQGDPAAARRLRGLAREAPRAGAGSGAGPATPSAADGGAAAGAAAPAWGGAARERLPLELELAIRRYFEAAPGASRAGRR